MEDEMVRITSNSNGIMIQGATSWAVRNGAYKLLERLGYRDYFRYHIWEVVPKSLIDPGFFDEISVPSYFYRRMERPITVPPYKDGPDSVGLWLRRQCLPGPASFPTTHNYNKIIDVSEYATHPEYFTGNPPDGAWQLNMDNPDVVQRAIDYARNELSKPDIPSSTFRYDQDPQKVGGVPITPIDGLGFFPPFDESNSQLITDKVFQLANDVARALGQEFPDKKIIVLSYYLYSELPSSLQLEPNLLPFITSSSWTGLSYQQRIEGFHARGATAGIYAYLGDWVYNLDLPVIDWNQIKMIGHYARWGARAYTTMVSDGWGAEGLTMWMAAHILYDHNFDVDAALIDFCDRCFGPAGAYMKRYFDTRNTDSAAMALSFQLLSQAETAAAGYSNIIQRIRYFELYTRFLWFWANIGYQNCTLDELKTLYNLVWKIRDLYLVHFAGGYVEGRLHTELLNRGVTEAEITALQDPAPPTDAECQVWLAEALVAFGGWQMPVINPLKVALEPLNATGVPELPTVATKGQIVLVPSPGNEQVTVRARGHGQIHWYDPNMVLADIRDINDDAVWADLQFAAQEPGVYIIYTTWVRPVSSSIQIDVPNRPASEMVTHDLLLTFQDAAGYANSAKYFAPVSKYFYVPPGTVAFNFRPWSTYPQFYGTGNLTDPNGQAYPYNIAKPDLPYMRIDNPVPGVWKVDMTPHSGFGMMEFQGIVPLVWHTAQNLLIPAQEEETPYNPPPDGPIWVNPPTTIAILGPTDTYLQTAAQELSTIIGQMSGQTMNIVQGDVSGPAFRLSTGLAMQYSLNLSTTGSGTTDPAPGTRPYAVNTIVALSAIPDSGWQFKGWYENGITLVSTEQQISVTMDRDISLNAVFEAIVVPPGSHALTISIKGQGTTDPVAGSYIDEDGSTVRIKANPASGWLFDHWEGSVSGNDNPISFTLLANANVVAVFSQGAGPPSSTPLIIGAVAGAALISAILFWRRRR